MNPGDAALCPGQVMHRRNVPTHHAFTRDVSMIWVDPDDPEALFDRHALWSTRRAAPVRFRPADYGTAASPVGSAAVLDDLEAVLPWRPRGPVRMLTQARQWGWLFNPFSLYLAWDDPADDPMGAVAEVTNTPWKERHRYPVRLVRDGAVVRADFDKTLHVSPFLGLDHRYDLRLRDRSSGLVVELDVLGEDRAPVIETRLDVDRLDPTKAEMRRFLTRNALATHRVSAGIHLEAAKLWAKRVPFVSHPERAARAEHADDTTGVTSR